MEHISSIVSRVISNLKKCNSISYKTKKQAILHKRFISRINKEYFSSSVYKCSTCGKWHIK